MSVRKRFWIVALCFCALLCTINFETKAATTSLVNISQSGKEYQYAESKTNHQELTYGTKTADKTIGSAQAESADGGMKFTLDTGTNKYFKLYYKEIVVRVRVPANTAYTVTFSTTLEGTFTVSNKRATAKYYCQLVYLGEAGADSSVTFYPGNPPTTAVGGSKENVNVLGYYIDPDTKSTTYTCGSSTTKTDISCDFVNNTGAETEISRYFGLWVACDYGSKYSNQGKATCTITPKSVSYTVTFDPNGGTVGTTSKTVTTGETYGTLPKPTRTGGYTFDGWYTKKIGGEKVTATSTVYDPETYSRTLYAHWSLTPAEAPVIDKINTDITVTYGYSPPTGLTCHGGAYHTLSQEWYECDKNGNNGKLVTDENGKPTYIKMPTAGVHYYYCEVIGTRQDNGLSARTKSVVIKVTVEKATPDEGNNYNLSASDVDLAVNETLSESILTGGEMRISIAGDRLIVPGTFSWVNGSIKLEKPQSGLGTYYEVRFTPDDTDNCNTVILKQKVWVRITCSHGNKWGAWQEDGTRTCTACGRTEVSRVSVTITWGAMEFTYSDGTWNPENHQYEDVGWIPNEEDGNRITIENTGKVTVNVSVCYTPDYSAVSGSFADLEGTVIESPVALPVNGKKSVWLILKGKPDKILNHTVIGTITVTLGGN